MYIALKVDENITKYPFTINKPKIFISYKNVGHCINTFRANSMRNLCAQVSQKKIVILRPIFFDTYKYI